MNFHQCGLVGSSSLLIIRSIDLPPAQSDLLAAPQMRRVLDGLLAALTTLPPSVGLGTPVEAVVEVLGSPVVRCARERWVLEHLDDVVALLGLVGVDDLEHLLTLLPPGVLVQAPANETDTQRCNQPINQSIRPIKLSPAFQRACTERRQTMCHQEEEQQAEPDLPKRGHGHVVAQALDSAAQLRKW